MSVLIRMVLAGLCFSLVSSVHAQIPDDLEPNDSSGTATVVAFGDSVATQFFEAGDIDYFSFTTGAGLVQLRLTGRSAPGATMVLSESNGSEIATAGTWLVADLASSDTYHVRVTYDEPFEETFNTYQFSVASFAADRIVAADGSGDQLTIAAGLAAAAANEVILVQPGSYDEAPIIDKNLHLVGANARTVFIGREVTIRADVVFQGFRLSNPSVAGNFGILVELDWTVSILDNILEDFEARGISCERGNQTISGNIIRRVGRSSNGPGINVDSDPHTNIFYNLLHDNGQAGIWLFGGQGDRRIVARENIIRNNLGAGISTAMGSRAEIRDNLIEGNAIGIRSADQGTDALYVNNNIRNNTDGMTFDTRSLGEARNNIISDNSDWGVLIRDDLTNVILRENEIRRNRTGIEIRAGGYAELYDNVVADNTGDGLLVTTAALAVPLGNEFRNNSGDGVQVNSAGILGNEFRENTITDNGGRGIYIKDENSRATIRRNLIGDNGLDGILVETSASADIDSNTFSDTVDRFFRSEGGIRIKDGAYATISNNTMGDHYTQGISVNQASAVISGNQLIGTPVAFPFGFRYGIKLETVTATVTVDSNVIEDMISGVVVQDILTFEDSFGFFTLIKDHAIITNNEIRRSSYSGVDVHIRRRLVSITGNTFEGKLDNTDVSRAIAYKVEGFVNSVGEVYQGVISSNQFIGDDIAVDYSFTSGNDAVNKPSATAENFPVPDDILAGNTFTNVAVSHLQLSGNAGWPVPTDIDPDAVPVSPFQEWTTYGDVQGLGDVRVQTSSINEVDRSRINNLRFLRTATGDLWAATDGGASRFDSQTGIWTTYSSVDGLGSDLVRSLLETASGNIWAATDTGASQFDPVAGTWGNYTRLAGLGSDRVRGLLETASGDLWAATDGGASFFDPLSGTWANFSSSDGLGNDAVASVFETTSGNLWAATAAGASRFNGTGWTNFTADASIDDPSFFSFFESRNGDLYGLTHHRVHEFDGVQWVPVVTGPDADRDPVLGIFSEHEVFNVTENATGQLWIGTDANVKRFDPVTGQTVTFRTALDSDGSTNSLQAGLVRYLPSGLWATTFDGYASHFDPTEGLWRSFKIGQGEFSGTDRTVVGLSGESDGGIWAMVEGVGVSHLGDPLLLGFSS